MIKVKNEITAEEAANSSSSKASIEVSKELERIFSGIRKAAERGDDMVAFDLDMNHPFKKQIVAELTERGFKCSFSDPGPQWDPYPAALRVSW